MVITTSLYCTASAVRIFGAVAVMFDAEFGHRCDGDGIDLVGGFGSGGADLDAVPGQMGQQRSGHLGAAGVMHANEQDTGFGCHGRQHLSQILSGRFRACR